MARRVFNFEGTNRGKFIMAGVHYVQKPLRLEHRCTFDLLRFVENNYNEVCNDGISKGFCTGFCKGCPIQGAHDQAILALGMSGQKSEIHIHVNCKNVFITNEPCAKDRGVKKD